GCNADGAGAAGRRREIGANLRRQRHPHSFPTPLKRAWIRTSDIEASNEITTIELDFVHFVMPARSAGITKWTKSAVFEKVTADRVSSGKTLLPEKISVCEHCLPNCWV